MPIFRLFTTFFINIMNRKPEVSEKQLHLFHCRNQRPKAPLVREPRMTVTNSARQFTPGYLRSVRSSKSSSIISWTFDGHVRYTHTQIKSEGGVECIELVGGQSNDFLSITLTFLLKPAKITGN